MATAEDALKSVKSAADSFAVTARQIQSGKGLFGALMHDTELKTDLKDLIANMKRNGVLFYRDSATKERERAAEKPASRPMPHFPGR
jgi:hypothetical protein